RPTGLRRRSRIGRHEQTVAHLDENRPGRVDALSPQATQRGQNRHRLRTDRTVPRVGTHVERSGVQHRRLAPVHLQRGGQDTPLARENGPRGHVTGGHNMTIPSDLDISRASSRSSLVDVAAGLGLTEHSVEPYGRAVAKISLDAVDALPKLQRAKSLVVSSITPSPLGAGKTTTTVGVGQAFGHLGKNAAIAIRQPSMGPTFGIKGGAAGGGYSQVVPMEAMNLHLTGDMHAVTEAHNLLAAMVDN